MSDERGYCAAETAGSGWIHDAWCGAAELASQTFGRAASTVSDVAGTAGTTVSDVADTAGETAQSAAELAAEKADDVGFWTGFGATLGTVAIPTLLGGGTLLVLGVDQVAFGGAGRRAVYRALMTL